MQFGRVARDAGKPRFYAVTPIPSSSHHDFTCVCHQDAG